MKNVRSASLGLASITAILLTSYLCLPRKDIRLGPPSVVLLIIDTLRADALGVYGSQAPASKELDELVEKTGVVFRNTISQASWTRASVASMLTGLYPIKTGVRKEKWDSLPLSMMTLAERLQKQGYKTIGLTANPQINKDFHFEQGFDHYTESTVLFPWMKRSEGKVKADKESPVKSSEEMFAEASRQVDQDSGTSPLYLQILIMDVHAHHRIKYEEVDEDLKSFNNPEYLQAVRKATRSTANFIKEIDYKLKGNVLFFVVSDHGEGLQDHPSVESSRGHGNLLYRSQVHVPLLVLEGASLSRFQRGVREHLTQVLDIVPTILEIASVSQSSEPLDGRSLLPILTDKNSKALNEYAYTETAWRPGIDKSAVVNRDWFYIKNRDAWPGTAQEELFPFKGPQEGEKNNHLQKEVITSEMMRRAMNTFLSEHRE
jgi:arylsulfatase A-like enzyme